MSWLIKVTGPRWSPMKSVTLLYGSCPIGLPLLGPYSVLMQAAHWNCPHQRNVNIGSAKNSPCLCWQATSYGHAITRCPLKKSNGCFLKQHIFTLDSKSQRHWGGCFIVLPLKVSRRRLGWCTNNFSINYIYKLNDYCLKKARCCQDDDP